jgi:hypothetical protein
LRLRPLARRVACRRDRHRHGRLTARLPIAEIGLEDVLVDAGGLGRRLRLFRLPDRNDTWRLRFEQPVRLRPGDNPLYVRLTQDDGHQAWSSPIYVIAG